MASFTHRSYTYIYRIYRRKQLLHTQTHTAVHTWLPTQRLSSSIVAYSSNRPGCPWHRHCPVPPPPASTRTPRLCQLCILVLWQQCCTRHTRLHVLVYTCTYALYMVFAVNSNIGGCILHVLPLESFRGIIVHNSWLVMSTLSVVT